MSVPTRESRLRPIASVYVISTMVAMGSGPSSQQDDGFTFLRTLWLVVTTRSPELVARRDEEQRQDS